MSSFADNEGMRTQTEVGDTSDPSVFSIKELLALLLTPVLAPVVGYVCAWVGTHFPGIHVDPGQTTDLIIAGIAFVLGLAIKALHSKDVRVAHKPLGPRLAAGQIGELEPPSPPPPPVPVSAPATPPAQS